MAVDSEIAAPIICRLGAFVSSLQQLSEVEHCVDVVGRYSIELVCVTYFNGSTFPDLLSGQVQVTYATVTSSIGYVKAGKLRALGVTTATRVEGLPDVPPIGQFVLGFEGDGLLGIGAPMNTPTEIIDKLNKEINAAVADPKMGFDLDQFRRSNCLRSAIIIRIF